MISSIKQIPKHALLILLCAFAIFPLYWMVISSLKPLGEIFTPSMFPSAPTLENYTYAVNNVPIFRLTLNTLIIASVQTVAQLVSAVMAAYALTRWEFKGRGLIFTIFSLTWLVPMQAIMIPNYITITSLGLRNTMLGVILPFTASTFAILSLYSALKSFPKALIEAAVMDKLSEFSILTRIVLPNIKPAMVSLGILLFIHGWNEYLWAMLVNTRIDQAPIQIGLQQFLSLERNEWGALMAAATLSSIPIIALYLALQKMIINSFVKWGIK
ncbi:MAG: carbohydrate ABC transporter permease [Peptococcaceae bacterium]|nr:carbohydrate ABC transporter permease [Peptococcaceae bacterium]